MNKSIELKTTTDIVKEVLKAHEQSRNSDDYLYFLVCSIIGKQNGFDAENMTMDVPGKYDVSIEGGAEGLVYTYCVPEDAIAKISGSFEIDIFATASTTTLIASFVGISSLEVKST